MSTGMLCAILRAPVPVPEHATPECLAAIQVINAARRAADLIEKLCAAVREANDADIEIDVSTDEMIDRWRKNHVEAIRAAEDFS